MPIALSVGLRLLFAALFVWESSLAAVPALKQMPIAFEPNQGQFETGIQFGAPNNGGQQVWIYSNRICIKSKNATVELYWRGGNSSPKVEGATKLPGTSNYIMGRDHRNWRLGVPQFESVRLLSIYDGIDLVV